MGNRRTNRNVIALVEADERPVVRASPEQDCSPQRSTRRARRETSTPVAMVDMLQALPGTPLHDRIKREGRFVTGKQGYPEERRAALSTRTSNRRTWPVKQRDIMRARQVFTLTAREYGYQEEEDIAKYLIKHPASVSGYLRGEVVGAR